MIILQYKNWNEKIKSGDFYHWDMKDTIKVYTTYSGDLFNKISDWFFD
jgi:hypothetical protein